MFFHNLRIKKVGTVSHAIILTFECPKQKFEVKDISSKVTKEPYFFLEQSFM